MNHEEKDAPMRGKHVVVTGGATGIGAAVCALLQSQGASVSVLDIRQPGHAVHRFLPLDLNDLSAVDRTLERLTEPVHALLNVAGLPPRPGQASAVLRVNFFGLRRLTNGLIPQMPEGGAVVNVSSRAGLQWRQNIEQVKALMALPDDADLQAFCARHRIDDTRAYNLSKEAVTAWTIAQTEALVARGLRMNAVSPGAVETSILGDFKAAFGPRVGAMVARVRRPGHPAEVAQVIAFLADPRSAWLKGVDVPVDGGMGALDAIDGLGLVPDARPDARSPAAQGTQC